MRVMVSVVPFLLGSTLVFGLVSGLLAFLEGGPSLPDPVERFSLRFSGNLALYGMFHWALLALVTCPLFVLPLVAFWLAGGGQTPRVRPAALVAVLAFAASLVRNAFLERPTLAASPSNFLTEILLTRNTIGEVCAFAGGLFAVRMWGAIANPRLQQTAPPAGARPPGGR